MFACMYACMHVYTCTHMHAHVRWVCVHMSTCTHARTCMHMHAECVYHNVRIHACAYIHHTMYVCICVCTCTRYAFMHKMCSNRQTMTKVTIRNNKKLNTKNQQTEFVKVSAKRWTRKKFCTRCEPFCSSVLRYDNYSTTITVQYCDKLRYCENYDKLRYYDKLFK